MIKTNCYFLKLGRFQAAVIAFQGRIWAVGGCEGWSPLNSVEIYDPHTGKRLALKIYDEFTYYLAVFGIREQQ